MRMLAERASMGLYDNSPWHANECGTINFEEVRQHARAYVLCLAEARGAYPYLGEDYRNALRSVTLAKDEKDSQQVQDQLALILDPIPAPTEPYPEPVYKPIQIISLQGDLKKRLQIPAPYQDLHFRRIVCRNNVAAIVYTQGPTLDERCGVVLA